jgi:hypothetical protein
MPIQKMSYMKDFDPWKPTCKYDVVKLLQRVQTGHASCGFASDVLFPQFATSYEINRRYKENEDSTPK